METKLSPLPSFDLVMENDHFVNDLKEVIRELAAKLKRRAPHLEFYSDSDQNKRTFEVYRSYPEAQKKRIYEDVSSYNSILDSMADSDPQVSNKSALWVALKLFGIPSSLDELFKYIEESDVIEVYRYDGIQVFRNLNFHDVCSYELPELFIYTWDQLFYRPAHITQKIAESAESLFLGKHRGIVDLDTLIGSHALCETFSPKRYKLSMYFKYLYPLRNKQNNVDYIVAVSKVKVEKLYFDYKQITSSTHPRENN